MTFSVSHPTSAHPSSPKRRPGWLLPTALITFGLLPIAANALRRVAIAVAASGPPPEDGSGMPLPAVLHVLGATVFVVLGALQFSADIRRRRPRWHALAGRLAIVGALLAAASGLWLAFAYLSSSSGLLFAFRVLAAGGLALSIVLGFRAIRRHRLALHRAWMIRAFALGLGAATQLFTLGFGEQLFGRGELSLALLNGAGWAINLAVAEWMIRRGSRTTARPVAREARSRP